MLDLFIELDANEQQLEFPVVYASAINGTASLDPKKQDENMESLYETILEHVPAPVDNAEEPLQFQVAPLITMIMSAVSVSDAFSAAR